MWPYLIPLVIAVLGSAITVGFAQNEPPTIRLEFLGKDPAVDWAKATSTLIDKDLAPIKTLNLQKGQSPCGAVLEQLKFPSVGLKCANEVQSVIDKLNPNLPSPAPVGLEIKYPALPLNRMHWKVGFDSTIPEEKDRYEKVKSIWKRFQIKETSSGTFRQLEYNGVAAELNIPATSGQSFSETKRTINESIDHFNPDLNRYDIRTVGVLPNPENKVRYSTPVEWAETCAQHLLGMQPPSPPGPSYLTLINGAQAPACARNCAAKGSVGCPQIVLLDQKVAEHPDLLPALQGSSSSPSDRPSAASSAAPPSASPMWCPMAPFDKDTQHGTHMAGIMVSNGKTSAFQGIAPQATLDSETIPDTSISSLLSDSRYHSVLDIYVYASKFSLDRKYDNENDRLHRPAQVEDILQSRGLWIVAAGQEDEGVARQQLYPKDLYSPMNLGDQANVLVVTNCEDCYSDHARISDWANFSSVGLVNVAAAGGANDRKIPSIVSTVQDGLANGTSQATALVAGLAAEMVSCYPETYVSAFPLKERIIASSWPFSSPGTASMLSAGAVDAALALLNPNVHWVTLVNQGQKSAANLNFCTDPLTVLDIESGNQILIPVKSIRRITRRKSPSGEWGWFIFYEARQSVWYQTTEHHLNVIKVTPLVRPFRAGQTVQASAADSVTGPNPNALSPPLLYFQNADAGLSQDPLPLDRIEDLLVGLKGGQIPPNFKGCSR